MRADVKLAMGIAVILIGIGVAWFVFYNKDESKNQKPDVDKKSLTDKSGSNKVVGTKPKLLTKTDPTPGTGTLIKKVWDKNLTAVKDPVEDVKVPSVSALKKSTDDSKWPVPYRPARAATSSTGEGMVRTTVGMTRTARTGSPTVTPRTSVGFSSAARTYVIKENDSYWSIAKDLWGDGTLHPHLEKANPGISPNDLRPRMTIKIPPKPVRTSSASSTSSVATARHGTTGVDLLTGKRYYIIKESDKGGFWDVSKAVYGHGKYCGLIEKANPKRDSRKLRPGMKIWCPEKTVKVAAVRSVRRETAYETPAREPVPVAVSTSDGAGAPTKATLPDGRIFD